MSIAILPFMQEKSLIVHAFTVFNFSSTLSISFGFTFEARGSFGRLRRPMPFWIHRWIKGASSGNFNYFERPYDSDRRMASTSSFQKMPLVDGSEQTISWGQRKKTKSRAPFAQRAKS